ncbi:MAG: DnaA N-terminal domain-containing protein [Chloroflexota bacterium]
MVQTASSQVVESVFCSPAKIVPVLPDRAGVEQAVQNACQRWPLLAPMVQSAAGLVANQCLYAIPGPTAALALCKRPAAWQGHLIFGTATGLACTCEHWPPPIRAGPGDGLYCPDILAYLQAVYLERPLPPLPYSPVALWQKTLSELQHQMTKATFALWLADTEVVAEAGTPLALTVSVPNPSAQAWLTHRLRNVIVRTLASVAGYRVAVRFVTKTMRNDLEIT